MKRLRFFVFVVFLYLPSLVSGQTKNIDCGCNPAVAASGWSVESPKQTGNYVLDPANIKLVSFENKTSPLKGSDIIEKTAGTALNACVFDYLMSHQEMIPESWKKLHVCFPATTFDDGYGNKFFRFIYWWDNKWTAGVVYLTESYDDKVVAIK